jgi:signal transduction histidine kinase
VIVPWQRDTFLQNLESKAHGVAVSLRDVAAGAVLDEDYSSIVDHCRELLQGDGSLSYIVITKNDGFSVIQDRKGWRVTEHMAAEWRPARRVAAGGIRIVPLFSQRAFHFSQPFDYSGLPWGWIHVGLSLEAYDASVERLYRRIGLLGAGCGTISLLASVLYARRIVRPILSLRATVQRVAGGDWQARAAADRPDELGSLAGSVNSMAVALQRHNELLGSVQFAAQRFLDMPSWSNVLGEVLPRIGRAAMVRRVAVIELKQQADRVPSIESRHEWAGPGQGSKAPAGPALAPDWDEARAGVYAAELAIGSIVAVRVANLSPAVAQRLAEPGVGAFLMAPVMIGGQWWGCLSFDDTADSRDWTAAERDSFRAAADMLGAAVSRQRAQEGVLEAKATLEQRVLERTVALRREVNERKEAEAAVARSLSVINATLESSVDGILVLGADGRVKHFNHRFTEIWRITSHFLTCGRNRVILHTVVTQLKCPQEFLRSALKLHADPAAESFDLVEFKDGRIFERLTRPLRIGGKSLGRVWCFRDITTRTRIEAEMNHERDLLQTLMDSLPDTLYFKDLESRFVRVSRSKLETAMSLLRNRHDVNFRGQAAPYPAHLTDLESLRRWLIGRTDFDVLEEQEARTRLLEEQAIIRSGRPLMEKMESIRRPSGETVWALVTKMPWRNRHGEIIGTYGISKDITAIKEAEAKLHATQQQLIAASRLAGMAEVATGVLHNVGNVLNSANVSATLVREQLHNSEVPTLERVAGMLQDHTADLAAFLTTDPKGRMLPQFIVQLSARLSREHAALCEEHEQLARNVEHLKEVVAMQQGYACVSGLLEKTRLADLIDDALRINAAGLMRHGIEVVQHYGEVPEIPVDRHKVLQILVNLVQNAKYALDEADRTQRRIEITMAVTAENRMQIVIADNGVGISRENLVKIFSHGFTTRRNGHGFGLHSGANAAREMGGTLAASSEGPGRGATFTLELPLNPGAKPS